jgi:Uma2 family endonuclease
MTVEEFEEYASLPENRDRKLEFVNGIVLGEDVEVVANQKSSEIAAFIIGVLAIYLRTHRIGRLTGADGGFIVGQARVIPDVALMLFSRQPQNPNATYNPLPPDLAVEVVSPSDSAPYLAEKLAIYLAARITLWLVFPAWQRVHVYVPDAVPVILNVGDTLTGGALLPDFSLALSELFAGFAPAP